MLRVAKSASGVAATNYLAFFLAPEFISTAVRQDAKLKFEAALNQQIVDVCQPQWTAVPYYHQLSKHTKAADLLRYGDAEHPWSGRSAAAYREILMESPAFGEPYDRPRLVQHMRQTQTMSGALHTLTTAKAWGLIHRHAFGMICDQVSTLIDALTHASAAPEDREENTRMSVSR
jgi:hypothetical protein